MNKIKIGYKEYNCSNIVYYHIQGLDSKSRYLKNEVSTKDKEIERLNNIIDKLEIDIEIGTGNYTYDTDYNRGLKDAFIYMSDRLQELKEKNENNKID